MAYTFEEIMSFSPDNQVVYDEISNNFSALVPFIGAGLSQFAYPSWPNALVEIAGKITNTKSRNQVKGLIKQQEYLDAAQLLEELRSTANLSKDLVSVFSKEKLEKKKEILPQQAVYLLPLLFQGLVLTTNFEETLETVYHIYNEDFSVVSHPGHTELLNQILRQPDNRINGLFKLHGTITEDMIEYSKFVFTKAQYEHHYAKDSSLTIDLAKCLKNKQMLFLGCSLAKDRTMDLLEEILEPGIYNYTIMGCKKSERDKKSKELGDRHIRAILYEKGRHEAVRVILEHLLEEKFPDKYQKLECHKGALESAVNKNRFVYDAEMTQMHGRDEEMRRLHSFLEDTSMSFKWWAITGPGGSGKSRLAYEFQKSLGPKWEVIYLRDKEYENLESIVPIKRNALIIADYVQEHAFKLGAWMEKLCDQKRSLPLRVLLVERDVTEAQEETSWVKLLYSNVRRKQRLIDACFENDFLVLEPLSKQALDKVIEDYATSLYRILNPGIKKTLNEIQRNMLLNKLQKVDRDLCRPLYAMFLTDAYVQGKNPKQWDYKDVLEYVLEREKERIQLGLREVVQKTGRSDRLTDACLRLLCIATICMDIKIKDLEKICPNEWEIIKRYAEDLSSPKELLIQSGITTGEVLGAVQPDLLGEYFVLDWLLEESEEIRKGLLTMVWKKSGATTVFFYRILLDYSEFLNENNERWNLVLPSNLILPLNVMTLYIHILVEATAECHDLCQIWKYVNCLETFYKQNVENKVIVLQYAKGLVNLSCRQEAEGALETSNKLKALTEKNVGDKDIVLEYAKGLFNLLCRQQVKGALETSEKLKYLMERDMGNKEMTLIYVKGLVNLSGKQVEKEAIETLEELKFLLDRNEGSKEIAFYYAKGLLYLLYRQDVERALDTLGKLEALSDENVCNEQIAHVYAYGLFDLFCREEEKGALETLERLKNLAYSNIRNEEITRLYALCLMNLCLIQNIERALESSEKLKALMDKSGIEEIAVIYAEGLFNLLGKQDVKGVIETLYKLQILSEKYVTNEEIALQYAKGLANSGPLQEKIGAVEKLKVLSEMYSENKLIVVGYALSLLRLCDKQELESAIETSEKLKDLMERNIGNKHIASIYSVSCRILNRKRVR